MAENDPTTTDAYWLRAQFEQFYTTNHTLTQRTVRRDENTGVYVDSGTREYYRTWVACVMSMRDAGFVNFTENPAVAAAALPVSLLASLQALRTSYVKERHIAMVAANEGDATVRQAWHILDTFLSAVDHNVPFCLDGSVPGSVPGSTPPDTAEVEVKVDADVLYRLVRRAVRKENRRLVDQVVSVVAESAGLDLMDGHGRDEAVLSVQMPPVPEAGSGQNMDPIVSVTTTCHDGMGNAADLDITVVMENRGSGERWLGKDTISGKTVEPYSRQIEMERIPE